MTTFNRYGETFARPEKENATAGNRGAEAKQNSGQDDYTATIMTPLDVALMNRPIEAAQLEVLNRIAAALERNNELLDGQQEATWSVAKNLDDLWRLLGERT